MNERPFPNHSGGVVQVRHVARYGAVPESLLEDKRLDLDSRAVAAWLAVKPSGWQINIKHLRIRLAQAGKDMLGKDRWYRIARELESAGYLSRQKVNGKDGQWIWHIIFNPVPPLATIVGFSDDGRAEHGAATAGWAGAALPDYKEIPKSGLQLKRTTTTGELLDSEFSREGNVGSGDGKVNGVQTLHYPKVTPDELIELKNIMVRCQIGLRQDVLDEIEGIRTAGSIKRGVVPLAKALIKRVAAGEFSLSAGYAVRAQRETRCRNELAVSVATDQAKFPVSISEEDIAKLPPNLAMRVREAVQRTSQDPLGPCHVPSESSS